MSDTDTEPPPAESVSMSDPAVCAFLTKQLCMHGGYLLLADIPSLVGLTPEHIASILREEGKRFPEPESGTVMAQSPVRLCTGYLGNKCQATDCGRLHLCRYFILGHCFFRGNRQGKFCRFSHNIRTEGNRAVLKANEISNLNEKELRALLQLNDPSCLPEVCYGYKGDKTDVPCHKAEECHRLHICQYFLRGQCRFLKCNRSHNLLDASAFKVMQRHGLSEELINNIQLLRMHQCKEARLEPPKWEWPKENKDKGHLRSSEEEKNEKRESRPQTPEADRSNGQGAVEPVISPCSTNSKSTAPSLSEQWRGKSQPPKSKSPHPCPAATNTTHPTTKCLSETHPAEKSNNKTSESPPTPPVISTSTYPKPAPCSSIKSTDKPDVDQLQKLLASRSKIITTNHIAEQQSLATKKPHFPVKPPSPEATCMTHAVTTPESNSINDSKSPMKTSVDTSSPPTKYPATAALDKSSPDHSKPSRWMSLKASPPLPTNAKGIATASGSVSPGGSKPSVKPSLAASTPLPTYRMNPGTGLSRTSVYDSMPSVRASLKASSSRSIYRKYPLTAPERSSVRAPAEASSLQTAYSRDTATAHDRSSTNDCMTLVKASVNAFPPLTECTTFSTKESPVKDSEDNSKPSKSTSLHASPLPTYRKSAAVAPDSSLTSDKRSSVRASVGSSPPLSAYSECPATAPNRGSVYDRIPSVRTSLKAASPQPTCTNYPLTTPGKISSNDSTPSSKESMEAFPPRTSCTNGPLIATPHRSSQHNRKPCLQASVEASPPVPTHTKVLATKAGKSLPDDSKLPVKTSVDVSPPLRAYPKYTAYRSSPDKIKPSVEASVDASPHLPQYKKYLAKTPGRRSLGNSKPSLRASVDASPPLPTYGKYMDTTSGTSSLDNSKPSERAPLDATPPLSPYAKYLLTAPGRSSPDNNKPYVMASVDVSSPLPSQAKPKVTNSGNTGKPFVWDSLYSSPRHTNHFAVTSESSTLDISKLSNRTSLDASRPLPTFGKFKLTSPDRSSLNDTKPPVESSVRRAVHASPLLPTNTTYMATTSSSSSLGYSKTSVMSSLDSSPPLLTDTTYMAPISSSTSPSNRTPSVRASLDSSPPLATHTQYMATTSSSSLMGNSKTAVRSSLDSSPPVLADTKYMATISSSNSLSNRKQSVRTSLDPSPPFATHTKYLATTSGSGSTSQSRSKPSVRASGYSPPPLETHTKYLATTSSSSLLGNSKTSIRLSLDSSPPLITPTKYMAATSSSTSPSNPKPSVRAPLDASPRLAFPKHLAIAPSGSSLDNSSQVMGSVHSSTSNSTMPTRNQGSVTHTLSTDSNTFMQASGSSPPTPTSINEISAVLQDEDNQMRDPVLHNKSYERDDYSYVTWPAKKVSQPYVCPGDSSPKNSRDPTEICFDHIWRFCKHLSKCPLMHYHLPYRWQIEKAPGVWEDLPCMEDIEKAYSDPNNTSSGRHNVHFEKMISSFQQVRRLSTTSSVTQPPDHLMTTKWVWHWKNEHGKWIEYGKHGGKEKATIASADLEKVYLADKKSVVPFQAGDQRYQIHFKDMIQKNLTYDTKKEVRRRPRFVSKDDIDWLKACGGANITTTQLTSSGQAIPSYWDRDELPDVGYKLVQINRHSMEFQEIEDSFELTMPNHFIQKVQRIQNITLWKFYQMQKETMKKQNRRDVLEKKLFHGTNKTHLHAICQNNFDWRICGVNGTLYGKGSYFARDASYSDGYCDSNSSSKSMFLARVLVGDFVKGNYNYTRPPPRSYTQDTFYDSCVDQDHNPSIFVIFEKHQIYPEYILEYSKNYQSYPENSTQTFQTQQNYQTQQTYQTQQNYQTLQGTSCCIL